MGHLLLRSLPAVLLAAACASTSAVAPSHPPGPAPHGRALYEESCQRCHALYMPATFRADEWRFYVRKYGRKARLNQEEQALVFDYLARHSSGGAG